MLDRVSAAEMLLALSDRGSRIADADLVTGSRTSSGTYAGLRQRRGAVIGRISTAEDGWLSADFHHARCLLLLPAMASQLFRTQSPQPRRSPVFS